jgi:hypothetical protein
MESRRLPLLSDGSSATMSPLFSDVAVHRERAYLPMNCPQPEPTTDHVILPSLSSFCMCFITLPHHSISITFDPYITPTDRH